MHTHIANEFFSWIKDGETGCLFAKFLAARPAEAKWQSVVLYPTECNDLLGLMLDEILAGSIGIYETIQFLFPNENSPQEIAGLLKQITLHHNWSCYEVKFDGDKGVVPVALRWHFPDKQHVNWAVGFARMESMPQTRKSPCTALVLRSGLPSGEAGIAKNIQNEVALREKDLGRVPVHLADVPTLLKTEKHLRAFWDGSVKGKQERLQSCPMKDVAKAKVTFAFPSTMRSELALAFKWNST